MINLLLMLDDESDHENCVLHALDELLHDGHDELNDVNEQLNGELRQRMQLLLDACDVMALTV